jgi:aminoglycoside 3-N-acetyltransferase
MKIYTLDDLKKAIKKVGIKKGDAVFIFPETYKFGIMENINFHDKVYENFYKVIKNIIGPRGTVCINSYSFDTLRFKKKFYYDKPVTTSGGFSNYILSLNKTIRSNHPAFSVASIGYKAKLVSQNNSRHNYGYQSPYEKFLRLNGKVLSLGADYVINPFIHIAEYMAGVPYYFNKYENFEIVKKNRKINKEYTSFVRYLNIELETDFRKLKKELKRSKIVKSTKLGGSHIYCSNVREYYDICLNLLIKDQFSLINKKKYLKSIKN